MALDGLIQTPRSWFSPAFAVQRSALPVISAMESCVGVNVSVRLAGSMSAQVVPSLFDRWYCCAVTAVRCAIAGGGGL